MQAPSVKGTIKSQSYINNNFLNELNISKKETNDLNKPILILDRNYHITTPNHRCAQGEAMQAVASPFLKFEPRILFKVALYSNKKF